MYDWFNGHGYNNLIALKKAGLLDWNQITEYSAEAQKALRGHSKLEWKTWLMDNRVTMDDIASELGLSKGSLYKKANIRRLSQALIGRETEFMGTLRKEIKKQKTIELLGEGVDPRTIMENFFHIPYHGVKQLKQSFSDLFSDERYDLKTIIETFSSDFRRFIGQYRL